MSDDRLDALGAGLMAPPGESLPPLSHREEYAGVTCEPTKVAEGPEEAGASLRLRCKLDETADRLAFALRRLAIRGVRFADRLSSGIGVGPVASPVPALRAARTPAPIESPIFMVGSERSGTTILGQILGHQEDVLYLNEARPIWYEAMPSVDEGSFHWEDGEPSGRLFLDESDYTDETKASLEQAFGWLIRFGGRKRLLEKLPINLFRVRWLMAMWPDAVFLQLVRDPFSTAASKAALWGGAETPGTMLRNRLIAALSPECGWLLETVQDPYERQLLLWRTCIEEGERLRNLFPDQYHAVRFEDVQREPEEVLARICTFLGLRFTSRLRRAYRCMLDRRIRLATPPISLERCRDLLGDSARRWGYRF